MSWWRRFGAWGAAIEIDMGHPTTMPPGSASMIVGVYVGLCLGTMDPEYGGLIRREIEGEMAAAMGVPPEVLESQIRSLIALKAGRR